MSVSKKNEQFDDIVIRLAAVGRELIRSDGILISDLLSRCLHGARPGVTRSFSVKLVDDSIVLSCPWDEEIKVGSRNQMSDEGLLEALSSMPRLSFLTDFVVEASKSARGSFSETPEISDFVWGVALQCKQFQLDAEIVQKVVEKTHLTVLELIGESKRDVSDAGTYIPGSAKERAAIRKLGTTEVAEEVERDFFSKARSSFSSLQDSASKFYTIADDEVVMIWPAGISLVGDIVNGGRRVSTMFKSFIQRLSSPKLEQNLANLGSSLVNLATIISEVKIDDVVKAAEIDFSEKVDDDSADENRSLKNCIHQRIIKAISSELASVIDGLSKIDVEGPYPYSYLAQYVSSAKEKIRECIAGKDSYADYHVRQWDEKRIVAAARKKAKEFGDDSLIALVTKRPQYAKFERRGGREINFDSPDELMDRFGLAAKQFGKSLTDKERREILPRLGSSLSDLADVLNLSDGQVGIGNALAVAIAARGKGGKDAPAAHYEPTYKVINLSKRTGTDGSLAHEFGHAMDFGKSGHSHFGALIEDPDVQDALKKVKKALFTSDRDSFVAARIEEAKEYSARHAQVKAKYSEGLAKAKEVKASFEKQIEEMQTAFANVADPDREAMKSEISELKLEAARRYRSELFAIDPVRLLANKLIRRVSLLNQIVSYAKSKYDVRNFSRSDSGLKLIPWDEIGKDESGEMRYPSEMVWDAAKIGSSHSRKGYWTSPEEMFARSFETWIAQKLNSEDRRNTFLVHDQCLVDYFISPYPKGAEREKIAAAMEEFVAVLKAKGHFDHD